MLAEYDHDDEEESQEEEEDVSMAGAEDGMAGDEADEEDEEDENEGKDVDDVADMEMDDGIQPPASPSSTPPESPSSFLNRVRERRALFTPPSSALHCRTYNIDPVGAAPHGCHVHTMAASLDMSVLLTGGADGFVRRYDFWATMNSKQMLTQNQRQGQSEGVVKAGVLLGYWDNEEELAIKEERRREQEADKEDDGGVDQQQGTKYALNANGEFAPCAVHSLVVHPDALWGISGTKSGNMHLFGIRHDEGLTRHTFSDRSSSSRTAHAGPVSAMALTGDETHLVSGGWDKAVHEWDLNTGQIVRSYSPHGGQVSSLSFRPLPSSSTTTTTSPSIMVGFSAVRESSPASPSSSRARSPGKDWRGGEEDGRQRSPLGSSNGDTLKESTSSGTLGAQGDEPGGGGEQDDQRKGTDGDEVGAEYDADLALEAELNAELAHSASLGLAPEGSIGTGAPADANSDVSADIPLSSSLGEARNGDRDERKEDDWEGKGDTVEENTDLPRSFRRSSKDEDTDAKSEASANSLFDEDDDADADAEGEADADAEGEVDNALALDVGTDGLGSSASGLGAMDAGTSLSQKDMGKGVNGTGLSSMSMGQAGGSRSRLPPPSLATSKDPFGGTDITKFSSDVMLSTTITGQVMLWDRRMAGNSAAVRSLGLPERTPPWCASACWSATGTSIYVGRRNELIDEWDLRMTGAADADGGSEYSASGLEVPRRMGNPRLQRQYKLPGGSGPVSCVRAMPDGKHLLSGSYDNVRLWNTEPNSKAAVPFRIVAGHHGGAISQILVDATCRYMITASGDRGWVTGGTDIVLFHEIGG